MDSEEASYLLADGERVRWNLDDPSMIPMSDRSPSNDEVI
ncbi:hypothetical protein EV647_8124 [Kribbella sp. VKM Ac-2566]|nr:hypothetical protein EV647_8124 [Kribbella sp. VKM Ac-2566]